MNKYIVTKISIFDNEDGTPVSSTEARKELKAELASGARLIPVGSCYRFDKQTGCKGHIYSIKPNDKAQQNIDFEYEIYLTAIKNNP